MESILKLYRKLCTNTPPKNTPYLAVQWPNIAGIRLAVDLHHNPAVLVDSKLTSDSNMDYALSRLEVMHNIHCKSRRLDSGHEEVHNVTVIKQVDGDQEFRINFLIVMEALLHSENHTLDAKDFTRIIDYLTVLFRSKKTVDKKVIVGLWGELFFILNSPDIEESIKAWHINTSNNFDFQFPLYSTEIKTRLSLERIHLFNNNQLQAYNNHDVFVVSILSQETDNGKNIEDLRQEIVKRCVDTSLQHKLNRLIIDTLGIKPNRLHNLRLDHNLAKQTARQYKTSKIPHIDKSLVGDQVLSIRLEINLNGIDSQPLSSDKLL